MIQEARHGESASLSSERMTTNESEGPSIIEAEGATRELNRTARNASGRKPSRKTEGVQEKILDAAAKVFAQKGYQLTKLSDISDEIAHTRAGTAAYSAVDGYDARRQTEFIDESEIGVLLGRRLGVASPWITGRSAVGSGQVPFGLRR